MSDNHYVAYVGTYTTGESKGIYIFDLDEKSGELTRRGVVEVSNPSDLIVSHNGKYLYSVSDTGISSFKIEENGDITLINDMSTGGMRGCYLCLDSKDRYLFVAGYYDGRVTMMKVEDNGALSGVAYGIFHKGLGIDLTERGSKPHVTCVKVTPDDKYLCAVDSGLNQVKIYEIDYTKGRLKLANVLRFQLEAAPGRIAFSREDGFAFVTCENKDCVNVYKYLDGQGAFELLGAYSTVYDNSPDECVPCALEVSEDGNYLYVTNAGSNTVLIFKIDRTNGELSQVAHTTVSLDYPKNITILPDGQHFLCIGHGTDDIRCFHVDYEKGYFLQNKRPVGIEKPSSIFIQRIG